MIKLFRQIRQNLIMESPAPPKASVSKVTTARTTRYLTYAIGEIILVVIGILIALQINNWNTSRQLKTLNQEFLIKMLAELDQNKDRLENDVIRGAYGWPGLIKATKACDSLLRL